MASSSDVVRKVMRFKLQLSDTAEPATVLKILQKLKKLDITLDILAETGIGKTVNSLRRHEQAGDIAKSLVTGWKQLMTNGSKRDVNQAGLSDNVPVKDEPKDQSCTDNGGLAVDDLNNNCSTANGKKLDSPDESLLKTENRKEDSEKEQHQEQKRKISLDKNREKHKQEREKISQKDRSRKKIEIQEYKKRRDHQSDRKSGDSDTLDGNKESEDTSQKSKEKLKRTSESQRYGSEGAPQSSKETSRIGENDFPSQLDNKLTNISKDVGDNGSLKTRKRKMDKASKEKDGCPKYRAESHDKKHSKHKKAKKKHKGSESNKQEPSVSFESYLNYDENVVSLKDRPGGKKPIKKSKKVIKDQPMKDPGLKRACSPVTPPQQKFESSIMHLMDVPLPAALLECENPSSVAYSEKKVGKESDIGDVSEEAAVFTGQRLYKKMQVYSGAKTAFLPTMMSLYQQCIRTLQNNINMLHETGGVPFEILEPVLERCTPEQLLRIEECNPMYIGETDHLWGKHCQKDFKHFQLEEYESWKEMYIRLFEERERKLKRLTKSIVSAHSRKPQGRQVKMAFIHTVAKPPRDVRIQQELHGTAVQQPQRSVKAQDSRSKLSHNEPSSRSSSSSNSSVTSSSLGGSNTQDPRKRTRVAPIMAKSLKAFKKQLQRR